MFGTAPFSVTPFAALPDETQTLSPALFANANTFYAASIGATYDLFPARYDNTNTFYAAAISGGSPVPIPHHPFCARGDLQIAELARANMAIPEAPRATMTVTTAARKSLYPGC